MNNSKIRFYTLDGKIINNLQINDNNILDEEKEVKTSKGFNRALKAVIEKDINFLSNKLVKIVKEVKKHLVINNVNANISNKIEDLEIVIADIETSLSNLIIAKNKIKVGIFSSNKKEKKNKIKTLQSDIDYISKCLNDIISIKNEYNKLVERNEGLKGLEFDEEEPKKKDVMDPLERTINFYMTKEN